MADTAHHSMAGEFTGEAEFGPEELLWYAETEPEPSQTRFMYFLDLSGERLDALERLRSGG